MDSSRAVVRRISDHRSRSLRADLPQKNAVRDAVTVYDQEWMSRGVCEDLEGAVSATDPGASGVFPPNHLDERDSHKPWISAFVSLPQGTIPL